MTHENYSGFQMQSLMGTWELGRWHSKSRHTLPNHHKHRRRYLHIYSKHLSMYIKL